ncbi:MAG: O-antigen ligase family protein, partial [Caldilineaceae bacterium]
AWLGLLTGMALAVYLNWRLTRRRGILGHLLDLMLVLAVLAAGAIWLAVAFNPAIGLQLGLNAAGGAGGSAASRVQLWQDTLPLLRDYWFTGSGLSPVAMIYATYSLLLHVPFLEHAHNLYLQVALEQGMVGLVAFVGLIVATLVRAPAAWGAADRTQRLLLAAGVASVTAMAVHGLFDAELYVSALAPLIFLSMVALQGSATLAGRTQRTRGQLAAGYRTDFRWLGVTIALLLALLPLARPHARAAFAANLGAVAQSRAELTAYLRPTGAERPFLQDAIRRSQSALLAPAVSFFNAALETDPANSTAHRRLGQIALAQGNLTVASEHLQAVVAVQPGDRVARQLLGELAALQNRPAEAVSRWRTVDLGQDQLLVRQWWYEALENPTHVRLLAFAVAAYEEAMVPE